jgi:hypothetical protein
LFPLDANLGVAGFPQSGTGQTALFTGLNAAAFIGKHFGPYPYSTLRPFIKERSIFKQVLGAGRRPYFANAFPQRYFDYMNKRPSHLTVTSLSCITAGIPLLKAQDLREGGGISADITGAGWRDLGYPDMPTIDAAEAGARLVELSAHNDFCLFEYWRTDKAGHSEDFGGAVESLERLDAMLAGIIEMIDIRSTLLVITSDHGNVEDMTTGTHTRNPVPVIIHGRNHESVADRFRSVSGNAPDLTHVTPVLMEFMIGQD